jgi:hypothetical protein
MSYYDNLETALRLIDKKGRTVTLRSVTPAAYDPLNDTQGSDAHTDRTVKAVFTSYKTVEIDGSIILQGDKKCLIADLSALPDTNDIIVDGGDEWRIVPPIDLVQPGDTPILYKLQVRR